MTSKAIIITAALFLMGCKDEDPPHWENVCVKTEIAGHVPVIIMAGKVPVTTLVPVRKCIETRKTCVIGDDYMGERACK